jgi:hypothetical protein
VWDYWKNPVNQLYFASSRESPLGSESAIFNRDGDLLRRFKLNRVLTFATSTNARVVASRHTSTFQFHETATGRKIGEFDSGVVGAYDTHISLSFDNKLFAIACTDTTILVWDIDRQLSNKPVVPAAKNTDDAEALWQQLGNVDPAEANPAMWALVRGPAPTLAVLGERLRPIRAPDSKQLQKLIAELDSGMFKERDSASRELAVIGEMALPSLRAALKNPASVEQRERIEKLIATLQDTVNVEAYLREVRALEVLERIGTAEAKKIVENMASGSTSALPTREAKLVLSRWR